MTDEQRTRFHSLLAEVMSNAERALDSGKATGIVVCITLPGGDGEHFRAVHHDSDLQMLGLLTLAMHAQTASIEGRAAPMQYGEF